MSPTRIQIPFARAALVLLSTLLCVALLAPAGTLPAQDRPASDDSSPRSSSKEGAPATGKASQDSGLNEAEASLSRRYRQFERTLLQMAEYLRKTEPERADLLIRAIGKSKEDRVALEMDQIMDLLKNDQLGDAIGRQEHLVTNLKGLLELLQSEDRRHQLEEEKKWLESLHAEIGKLSVRQKELRRATERTKKIGSLAERQGKIGQETKGLEEKIDKQDAARNAAERSSPAKPGKAGDKSQGKSPDSRNKKEADDKKGPDGKPKSKEDSAKPDDKEQPGAKPKNQSSKGSEGGKKSESQKSDSKESGPKKSESKKSESKKSQQGKKNPSKPNGSQPPNDSQEQKESSGENPPQPDQSDSPPQQAERKTPGRKEIEEARRAMQQAEEELKRLQGNKALDRQDEAIRKLAEAKERLEKVLRQLREEEQEIMLTSLEARFAKMLLLEIQVHVDTVTLAKTGKNAWTARHFGKARELSVAQETIADEARKALTLLKEEGSSVAFPQGVEQIRDDMLSIVRRLSKNDVGELTQSIEKDVIESLEELVSALQSEIENRKKPEEQRRRQQRQAAGQPEDKQLVERIAELKMLRSLQLRVNRRTKQIGRLIHGEQAASDDLAAQLQGLARRQAEIQEATYILASGRNQ